MIDPTHCEYSIDQINACIRTDPEALIREAEENFDGQLDEVIERFSGHRILCLAGPSGSGKTTAANKLKCKIQEKGRQAIVLSMDDFYKDQAKIPLTDGQVNLEVIEALEIGILKEKINELLRTGRARLPRYDFQKKVRIDHAVPVELPPDGCILIEGIHGLHEQVAECFEANLLYRVYISPHSGFQNDRGIGIDKRQVRLIRRLIRDRHHRASDPLQTLNLWEKVCAAEDLYVRPMARFANDRINSAHVYEPCLFREEAIGLLWEIPADSKYRQMTENLIYSLEQFVPLSPALLPPKSLLREFTKN